MKTRHKLAAGICMLAALTLTSFTEYVSLEIGKPVPKAGTKVTDVSVFRELKTLNIIGLPQR